MSLFRRAAASVARRYAASVSEGVASVPGETPKSNSTLQLPTWGVIGLGVAAAGFFGKMLHDNNMQTRQDMVQFRTEIRQDMSQLRTEMREDIMVVREDVKSVREDVKSVERKVDDGFKQLSEKMDSIRPTGRR